MYFIYDCYNHYYGQKAEIGKVDENGDPKVGGDDDGGICYHEIHHLQTLRECVDYLKRVYGDNFYDACIAGVIRANTESFALTAEEQASLQNLLDEEVRRHEDSLPMSPNRYQKLAMRTNDGSMTERLMHAKTDNRFDIGGIVNGCLGLSGEAGELVDLVKKWIFHEKPLDEEHAKKELGDTLWYAALICNSFGWKMEDIMRMNIDKLKARYPEGFSAERANNRKEGDI